jgi:6-pyruvoyltetrahydropterin/6-carboxytetrahydropterin synthase
MVGEISISVAAHNTIFMRQNSGISLPAQPLPLRFVYHGRMKQRVAVVRREHFNAAHRLYRKDWTDEQNSQTFGKCSLPNYHGHNYELEIKVVGEIDEATGYVMDLKKLSDLVNEQVLEKFDHRNLNVDVEEFKSVIPTAENIAVVIYNLLRPHIPEQNELFIRLFETPRNFVEFPVA